MCRAQLADRLTGNRRGKAGEGLQRVGGFGSLLVFGFDYADNPEAWHNSLRLLAQDVAPRIKHLTPV